MTFWVVKYSWYERGPQFVERVAVVQAESAEAARQAVREDVGAGPELNFQSETAVDFSVTPVVTVHSRTY